MEIPARASVSRPTKKRGYPPLMVIRVIYWGITLPFSLKIFAFLNRIFEGAEAKVSVFLIRIVGAIPTIYRAVKMFHLYSSFTVI
jgi:hypothetical protein